MLLFIFPKIPTYFVLCSLLATFAVAAAPASPPASGSRPLKPWPNFPWNSLRSARSPCRSPVLFGALQRLFGSTLPCCWPPAMVAAGQASPDGSKQHVLLPFLFSFLFIFLCTQIKYTMLKQFFTLPFHCLCIQT